MKKNYLAWNIDFDLFDQQKTLQDKLRFLIQFAVLAPSGHNTQPWRFLVKDDVITLFHDEKRDLPKSDPNDRQLYISLGCALENLLIASDYFQFYTRVEYLSSGQKNVAAKIFFTKKTPSPFHTPDMRDENHLVFSIPKRRTNRRKYVPSLPEKPFLDKMSSFGEPDFQINTLHEPEQKNAVADIVVRSGIDSMNEDYFREELSHCIKSNFTRSKYGMPGFTQGIPAPVSFFASKLVKKFNMAKLSMKQDQQLLKDHTPLFVIVSSIRDDKKSWVQAGQLYERIALEAIRNGLQTSPMAAPIQRENARDELKKILGITLYPQIFSRVGYCKTPVRATPRFYARDVIFS